MEVREEDAEPGHYTARLFHDKLVQIELHPFFMKVVWLNQPFFFANTANYSLLNTDPNETEVCWDLIQPSIIHTQL